MNKKFAIFALLWSLFFVQTVQAEVRGRNEGNAANQIKAMISQLTAQRDAALAENKKLQAKLAELEKDMQKKEKTLSKTKNILDKSKQRGEKLTEKLKDSYERLKETFAKNKQLTVSLSDMTIDRDKTKSEFRHCLDMNLRLYDAGIEVLTKYEEEASKDVNPIFQIKSVEIENTVQDYRYKMEDFTLKQETASNKTTTGSVVD